ncbi:HAD-IA family hydrolase [Propionibacteriaceae bacterium Y1923]
MYRHVFWDLGGTLVNTYPQLDETLAGVVHKHGGQVTTAEVATWTRRSTGAAIDELARRFGIPVGEFEAAEAALKDLWRAHPAPAMPGARELMDDVAAAGGLNLVVTHRDRDSAMALIGGLELPVDDLVSTSDGHPRKPDPAMYLAMLQAHDLSPEDCLGVGDRPIDAEAAHAAGIDAAVLESAAAPVDDDAEHSVEALDQLRPLLGLRQPES